MGKSTRPDSASLPAAWPGPEASGQRSESQEQMRVLGMTLRYSERGLGCLASQVVARDTVQGRGPLFPHLHGLGHDKDLCKGPGQSRGQGSFPHTLGQRALRSWRRGMAQARSSDGHPECGLGAHVWMRIWDSQR